MRSMSPWYSPARAVLGLALPLAALLAGCSSSPLKPATSFPPLASLTVTPKVDTLVVAQTAQFVATAIDTSGHNVSSSGLNWRTSNPAVISVSTSGLVTANSEGVAKVYVSGGGKTDSAVVAVYTQTGWFTLTSNTLNNLNGVFIQSDGRLGWAVGDAGTVLVTGNAGGSWATQVSNTAFKLNGVWFTSATEGWIAGNGGTILHTLDTGTTWTRLTNVGASENLNGVCFADAMHGWAVGTNGAIVRTRDGGGTWTKQNPSASQLYSISFSDTSNGWAVGESGTILGTHDGGASWYVLQPSLTAQALHGVRRLSNTDAWAVGVQGVVARSTATVDSLQWTLSSVGAANALQGVAFVDNLTGYAVGVNGNGAVLKTVDGGTTWDPQVSNSAQKLNAVWFVDALRGWAVGDGGRIVHTARGGVN